MILWQEIINLIITIFSYVLVVLAIIFTLFVYISFLWSHKIIEWRMKKIKEKRKEVIKIVLQDLSLFIQISIGIGIALMLFSLSRHGAEVLAWFLFGLIGITTGIFLLFWRYLPFRTKLYALYGIKKEH